MAVDQIALLIPETKVNEGSAFTATAAFRTRSTGAASTPTSIKVRFDCLSTGQQLADWTDVSPASSVSIPVIATYNAIVNAGSDSEVKQLTVASDFGLATQCVQVIAWRVVNLLGSP